MMQFARRLAQKPFTHCADHDRGEPELTLPNELPGRLATV
jgi:hypothetical protein